MQVIALTEELLATAKQSEFTGFGSGTNAGASPSLHQSKIFAMSKSKVTNVFPGIGA